MNMYTVTPLLWAATKNEQINLLFHVFVGSLIESNIYNSFIEKKSVSKFSIPNPTHDLS